ncbi:hypothetical protein UFOVP115_31 [uncultured Caudovirales phage]|uniref:Uncharacterized protein n=1 Tax=uncultured Caudovirales phage TaxID=2100421 RepID=A0A6J5L9J3_9CAUD|nr:hypothetical protein UFOVP115_31 [uncultured Caudovirales phage]
MATYGLKTYGTFRYSDPTSTGINVYPFTARSLDYGSIRLSFVYPKPDDSYDKFVLIRNPLGFPVTPDNGDLIVSLSKTAINNIFIDTGATIASVVDTGPYIDPSTGASTGVYSISVAIDVVNQKVIKLEGINNNISVGQSVRAYPSGNLTGPNAGSGVIGGTTVTAISNDPTNTYSIVTLSDYATVTAGTSLSFYASSLVLGKTYYYSIFVLSKGSWQRVGTALGTSVKNYNTADTMYNSLPEIYKSTDSTSMSGTIGKNVELYNFLRVFAVEHDFIKTKVENAKNRYDITNLDGRLIPALMDEMGFSYESGMGIQQGRRLLHYADSIYLNKGTAKGIRQFATAFSGYTASVASFKNLFLTLDCSSFESSTGFWQSTGTSLIISQATPSTEPGGPTPYSEPNSPIGYPNSRLGYLKALARETPGTGVSCEISYGVSPDDYNISTSTTNSATPSWSYLTLTTTTEHGLKVGDKVVVQNMSPKEVNGIWPITAVPGPRSLTVYASAVTASVTAKPYGAATIGTQTPTGTTNITITTTAAHSIIPGQSVTVSGVVPVAYNGVWTAQSGTTGSTLILNIGSNPGAITNGGITVVSPGTVNKYDPTTYGIPVSEGTPYQFSLRSLAKTAAVNIGLGVRWYNWQGDYISKDTVTSGNNTVGSWAFKSFGASPITSPSGAAYAVPYVYYISTAINTVIYFDAMQFEQVNGTATDYAEARRIDTYLSAVRVNEAINPGFEDGVNRWTATNASSVTTDATNVYPTAYTGIGAAVSTNSAKIVASGSNPSLASNPLPVTAGSFYSLSAYAKCSGKNGVASITWMNGSTVLYTDSGGNTRISSFTRIYCDEVFAPFNATHAVIKFTFSAVAGNTVYLDSVLFEASPNVGAYFDGSTGYNNLKDIMWEQNAAGTGGTSLNSRSLYYPNLDLVQSRLNTVLPDYLPMGSTFALFVGRTLT